MQRWAFFRATLLVGALASANVAVSDDKKQPNKAAEADPIPKLDERGEATATLSTAYRMIEVGRKEKSVFTLLAAAELINKINTAELQVAPQREAGSGPASAVTKAKSAAPTPASLIVESRGLAGENTTLLDAVALVERKIKEAPRGAAGGPKRHVDAVEAYSTDSYSIVFRAGEQALVVVSGDGDTDLDLYIYDENGNVIASDTDYSDDCVASFVPKWTGQFFVRVKNRGGVYNQYILATN